MFTKTHFIKAQDNLVLNVKEYGNLHGKTILFIHGFSQSQLVWTKQINSVLAKQFHIVTFDIRGHGLSDKPYNAYDNSLLWANDIQKIIKELNLNHPILCGWSYGGLIITDYLRIYGDANVSKIILVCAVSELGTNWFNQIISQDFLTIKAGFNSNNTEETLQTIYKFVNLLTYKKMVEKDFYLFFGFNIIVPPYVRHNMLSRIVDNRSILFNIRKPVLVIHGENDRLIPPIVTAEYANNINNATVIYYNETGHTPFWENSERFNRELEYFIAS